jgi:hypothetical protein
VRCDEDNPPPSAEGYQFVESRETLYGGHHMSQMPEPYRSACTVLLYEVFQLLRHHGFGEAPNAEELSDLGYLLHNIPSYIQQGDYFNIESFRIDLKTFDKTWNRNLAVLFEEHVAKAKDRP